MNILRLSVKSKYGESELVKGLILNAITEEKKRLEYALKVSLKAIKEYETKYGLSTPVFLEKFKKGEIQENDDTFSWWAETRLIKELEEKLKTLEGIEIC